MFILHHDEETGIVAEQLDAPAEGALRVNGQAVGVKQDNRLEPNVVPFDIGFSKKFELFANKLDALAMRAIDKHDIGFDSRFLMIVYQIDEIVDEGPFARPVRPVKQEIRDAIVAIKSFEFTFNGFVH